MPPRLTGAQAAARVQALRLTPLEPYPGSTLPWLVRCDVCGDHRRPRLGDITQGHRVRCSCYDRAAAERAQRPADDVAAELSQYGVRLVGRPPIRRWKGTEEPGEGECLTCGDRVEVRLGSLRRGCAKGCSCDPPRLTPRDGTCAECDLPMFATGMCVKHYNAHRSARLLDAPCTVDGCDNGQIAAGLCASHYSKGPDHVIAGRWGYDPAGEAVLYLIRDGRVWKYGKCMRHRLDGRLAQHRWHTELVDVRPGTGAQVTRWERSIRHRLRAAGIAPVLDGRDGQRETHYRDDLDPRSLSDALGH